jgi:hypothetical protein
MTSSQHPTTAFLDKYIDDETRLLAVVMFLPLIDGLFPVLVLTGALDTVTGIVEVGLLIFGGSATVTVIVSEMDSTRKAQSLVVLLVGSVLIVVAIIEAMLAPTIINVLDTSVFERFAAIVILTVAARTASARIAQILPGPGTIVGLGLVASLDFSNIVLDVQTQPEVVWKAFAASGVGVGFALLVALIGPWLRQTLDLEAFRFGSAVALGVLPLTLFGVLPANTPLSLAVLGVTVVFSFDP